MRRFKDKSFARFARRAHISDGDLLEVIAAVEAGLADADLGGYVYKQRTARQGEGKHGGYRVLLFFRSGDRILFYDGFAKSSLDNIKDNDLAALKIAAKGFMTLTDGQLDAAVSRGAYIEFYGAFMARKFRNRLMKHVYESGKLYYELGAINAEQLREVEALCVQPESDSHGSVSRGVSPAAVYAGSGRSGRFAN